MLVIFTGALVLFTAVLAFVAFLQYRLVFSQDRHFRYSERAWILTALTWADSLHVASHDEVQGGVMSQHTMANVLLIIRNAGRSPAWIEEILARAEIGTEGEHASDGPYSGPFDYSQRMAPVAQNEEGRHPILLRAVGHLPSNKLLRIIVRVKYRDIFRFKRETDLEYTCDAAAKHLVRDLERDRRT